MLMHWHYYNCHPYPDPDKPHDKEKSFLADLTPMQYTLVMDTIRRPEIQRHLEIFRKEREGNGEIDPPSPPDEEHPAREYRGSQSVMDWDEPYYWVAQMFEEHWRPHKTYMREKEPIRRPAEPDDELGPDDLIEGIFQNKIDRADGENVEESKNGDSNPGGRESEGGELGDGELEQDKHEDEEEKTGELEELSDGEIYNTAHNDLEDDSASESMEVSPKSDRSGSASASSITFDDSDSHYLKTFPFLRGRDPKELEELRQMSRQTREFVGFTRSRRRL